MDRSSHRKNLRPPLHNPFEQFSGDQFNSWVGGVTANIRNALRPPTPALGFIRNKVSPHRSPSKHTSPFIDPSKHTVLPTRLRSRSRSHAQPSPTSKGKGRAPDEGPGVDALRDIAYPPLQSDPGHLGTLDNEADKHMSETFDRRTTTPNFEPQYDESIADGDEADAEDGYDERYEDDRQGSDMRLLDNDELVDDNEEVYDEDESPYEQHQIHNSASLQPYLTDEDGAIVIDSDSDQEYEQSVSQLPAVSASSPAYQLDDDDIGADDADDDAEGEFDEEDADAEFDDREDQGDQNAQYDVSTAPHPDLVNDDDQLDPNQLADEYSDLVDNSEGSPEWEVDEAQQDPPSQELPAHQDDGEGFTLSDQEVDEEQEEVGGENGIAYETRPESSEIFGVFSSQQDSLPAPPDESPSDGSIIRALMQINKHTFTSESHEVDTFQGPDGALVVDQTMHAVHQVQHSTPHEIISGVPEQIMEQYAPEDDETPQLPPPSKTFVVDDMFDFDAIDANEQPSPRDDTQHEDYRPPSPPIGDVPPVFENLDESGLPATEDQVGMMSIDSIISGLGSMEESIQTGALMDGSGESQDLTRLMDPGVAHIAMQSHIHGELSVPAAEPEDDVEGIPILETDPLFTIQPDGRDISLVVEGLRQPPEAALLPDVVGEFEEEPVSLNLVADPMDGNSAPQTDLVVNAVDDAVDVVAGATPLAAASPSLSQTNQSKLSEDTSPFGEIERNAPQTKTEESIEEQEEEDPFVNMGNDSFVAPGEVEVSQDEEEEGFSNGSSTEIPAEEDPDSVGQGIGTRSEELAVGAGADAAVAESSTGAPESLEAPPLQNEAEVDDTDVGVVMQPDPPTIDVVIPEMASQSRQHPPTTEHLDPTISDADLPKFQQNDHETDEYAADDDAEASHSVVAEVHEPEDEYDDVNVVDLASEADELYDEDGGVEITEMYDDKLEEKETFSSQKEERVDSDSKPSSPHLEASDELPTARVLVAHSRETSPLLESISSAPPHREPATPSHREAKNAVAPGSAIPPTPTTTSQTDSAASARSNRKEVEPIDELLLQGILDASPTSSVKSRIPSPPPLPPIPRLNIYRHHHGPAPPIIPQTHARTASNSTTGSSETNGPSASSARPRSIARDGSVATPQTNRNAPVTRSNCRFHKISIPQPVASTDSGTETENTEPTRAASPKPPPLAYFIVPGCALSRRELMEEEGIEDCGEATEVENETKTPNFSRVDPGVFTVLRKLVGMELFNDYQCCYLPSSPEERELLTRHHHPLQPGPSGSRTSQLLKLPPALSASRKRKSRGSSISKPISQSQSRSPSKSLSVTDDAGHDSDASADTSHSQGSSKAPTKARQSRRRTITDLAYVPSGDPEESDEDDDTTRAPKRRKKARKSQKPGSPSKLHASAPGSEATVAQTPSNGKNKKRPFDGASIGSPSRDEEAGGRVEDSPRKRFKRSPGAESMGTPSRLVREPDDVTGSNVQVLLEPPSHGGRIRRSSLTQEELPEATGKPSWASKMLTGEP